MKLREEIIAKLKHQIADLSLGNLQCDSIKETDEIIGTLGLDSLDYATVMLQIQNWSNINIRESDVQWGMIKTVGELSDLFIKYQQEIL